MNLALFSSLLCPLCQQALRYDDAAQALICDNEQLAFPIKDGIPVMLKDEARALSANSVSADATDTQATRTITAKP